jgi:hypothetical protein
MIANTVFGQNGEVYEWVDYLPYHKVFSIAEGNEKVYGATYSGLIELTKDDNSFLRFSKVEGLSDIGVSCVGYNEVTETFVVGYINGKIDLITPFEIITITDLNRKTIGGNKSLNKIHMQDQFAYIAAGFGIIKFDVERREFAETYLLDENGGYLFVNDVTIANDTIYAATAIGVRKAYLYDPQITFYETWVKDMNLPYPDNEYNIIESYGKRVFTNLLSNNPDSDTVYEMSDINIWTPVTELYGKTNKSISAYSNYVLISHFGYISSYDNDWNAINKIHNYGEGTFVSCNDAILGKDSVIWIGDNEMGVVKNPRPFWYTVVHPESPNNAKVDAISIKNNRIWIAAGGRENNWNNVYSNDGVYWRNESLSWDNINKFKEPILDSVYDIIDVIFHPQNPNLVYGASLGGGLIEFTDYTTTNIFDETNSELKDSPGLPGWVGVTGFDYDKQGNLWMSNSRNEFPIAVYTYDQKWYSFSVGSLISEDLTGSLIVSDNGYKWTVLPHAGKGILVFDDGGTLDDITDDQSRILNNKPGSGGLPSNDIYSIIEDKDGEIWVGTAEGVAVFHSPNNVFSTTSNIDAQQIIVSVDGYFQYLLGTETVTSIAVDGANRKWFGTRGSGVFLMSDDGTTELYHFTVENSPLISNFIRTIEINESTGEVLFGTNEGIIAFKGSATDEEARTTKTYAYPNPVPQNYFGIIAIKGLTSNSAVRITDIAGNLVFETIAEGTQAVWNGNNMNGQRVATGVYLVFGIDSNGNDSQVAKVLFTQ